MDSGWMSVPHRAMRPAVDKLIVGFLLTSLDNLPLWSIPSKKKSKMMKFKLK